MEKSFFLNLHLALRKSIQRESVNGQENQPAPSVEEKYSWRKCQIRYYFHKYKLNPYKDFLGKSLSWYIKYKFSN